MKLNRSVVEKMMDAAGLVPEGKLEYRDREIYIADGFAAHPENTFRRFGCEPGEFPFGCYCVMWFIAKGEDFFELGRPMLFDAMHDKDKKWSLPDKRRARINSAIKEAKAHVDLRKELNA